MKTPVSWNSLCFVHRRSDDRDDHYALDESHGGPDVGRLRHNRASDMWLASLRGAVGTADRHTDMNGAFECERDVARRALDEALSRLRSRFENDSKWLVMIDEEIGIED
jgi:hypothetical protein